MGEASSEEISLALDALQKPHPGRRGFHFQPWLGRCRFAANGRQRSDPAAQLVVLDQGAAPVLAGDQLAVSDRGEDFACEIDR